MVLLLRQGDPQPLKYGARHTAWRRIIENISPQYKIFFSLLLPLPPGECRGEGALLRDVLTLSFPLGPSCHSDLVPLVIPDVLNRESKGQGEGDQLPAIAGDIRRSPHLLRSLHRGVERKRLWIPAKNLRE